MRYSTICRLIDSYSMFVQRPYFSRVWVAQELSLAQKVILCCGAEFEPAENLIGLELLLENFNILKIRLFYHKIPTPLRGWVGERLLLRRFSEHDDKDYETRLLR